MDKWKAVRTELNFDTWQQAFVGNGYLGLRLAYSGEGREIEDESWYSASVMCAGLFGSWSRNPKFKMECAVQLPNFLHFEPSFHPRIAWRNDPWVEWDDYRQELDFRYSTCTTSYRLRPNGWRFRHVCWPHRTHRHLVIQEMHVAATSGPYEMGTGVLNPLGQWKNYTQGCELLDGRVVGDAQVVRGAVTNTDIEFAYAERLIAPFGQTGIRFQAEVPAGREFTIYKVTAFSDSRRTPKEQLESFVLDQVAGIADLPALRREHAAAWDDLWSRVPEFDHPLNDWTPAVLYILLTSLGSGLPVDMQVCGLSNTRPWMGKSFEWDQSIFVLPGLMTLYPKETRDLLEGHLRRYAVERDLGWDAKSGGSPAFAMRLFRDVTGDEQWFRAQAPRLRALMANIEKRAVWNPTLGQYEIRGTHPADERGPLRADNNLWTNAVIHQCVKTALECLGDAAPAQWREMDAKGFWLPFDAARGGYLEYSRADGTQAYDGHERKQADVELAYFPLEHLPAPTLRADFDYYAPKITPWGAPEMQNGWFAAIETMLGRPERALGWLEAIVAKWVKGDYRIFCEMQTNYRGLFTTGAGDYLDGLVFGLLGARVRRDRLEFRPALCPTGLKAIRCRRIHLCGAAWSVGFTLEADGHIAYRIEEVNGPRTFAGRFSQELVLTL
jgi:trehalose/maltose hydrolase-like predicted phosphorylase